MKKVFISIVLLFLCFSFNCQQKADAEKNKRIALARQVIDEAWNNGDLNILNEVYTSDFVQHRTPYPDIEGLDGYKNYIEGTRDAYPDLKFTIKDIIIDGDKTVLLFTFRGTHKGESVLFPVPPTGNKVEMKGCTVSRYVDGKTVEEWVYSDWLSLIQQIGFKVIPPQEQE